MVLVAYLTTSLGHCLLARLELESVLRELRGVL